MKNKIKMFLLKSLLSNEQRKFITSALYTAEQTYRDKYNNLCDEESAITKESLRRNIPKLVDIRTMFEKLI